MNDCLMMAASNQALADVLHDILLRPNVDTERLAWAHHRYFKQHMQTLLRQYPPLSDTPLIASAEERTRP